MNIAELDAVTCQGWPALEELHTETGILRWAAGVSRRANSFTAFRQTAEEAAAAITLAENFYFPRALPAIIRVLDSPGCPEFDAQLAAAGYSSEACTAVMTLPFQTVSLRILAKADVTDSAWQIENCSRDDWLQAWYGLRGHDVAGFATHSAMLSRPGNDYCFLLIRSAGQILATAMSVLSADAVGIFGVATSAELRRQGLAEALVKRLLCEAASNGARYGYLQVETANAPAVSLYSKLGFRCSYRYWYRVKEFNAKILHENVGRQCRESVMESRR